MSRSVGLAHIIRQDDGSATGMWGVFALHSAFQPIFAFEDGKLSVVAFEGLIRPFRDGEPISPGEFFSIVSADDRLAVETLTRTLHLLNAAVFLPSETSVFVNFDPSVFTERAIAEAALRDMRLVLHEAGIDPCRVVCEVTEQKTASGEALGSFVEALRLSGFRIAVDDFGADESDMQRIRELRPDIVKFDAQWIGRLMESGPGFDLLSEMVERFEAQGIRTVFEGIQESRQLELAEQSGASMVQGFILARPKIVPETFSGLQQPSEVGAPSEETPQPQEAAPEKAKGHRTRKGAAFGRRRPHS